MTPQTPFIRTVEHRLELVRKLCMVITASALALLIAGITLMRFGWDTLLPMLNIPESFRTLAITSCGGLVLLLFGPARRAAYPALRIL